jgi:hypothetical protein
MLDGGGMQNRHRVGVEVGDRFWKLGIDFSLVGHRFRTFLSQLPVFPVKDMRTCYDYPIFNGIYNLI